MASIPSVDGLDVASVRLFLDVVELGSVSKAATRHRLAQPSATSRLQKLERQLGVQLLERAPSGSSSTAAGQQLAAACADFVAAAVALVDRANDVDVAEQRLVIAATRHAAEHFLPTWIETATIDVTQVELIEDETLGVAQAVRSAAADIGFTDGPAAPIGLRSRPVASEDVVAAVGHRHPWFGRRRPVGGADLVGQPLALPPAGSGGREVIDAALAPFQFAAAGPRVAAISPVAARVAALGSPVVALLPRCSIADDGGALRVIEVRDLSITQVTRVVWRGARSPARAERLVAALPRA